MEKSQAYTLRNLEPQLGAGFCKCVRLRRPGTLQQRGAHLGVRRGQGGGETVGYGLLHALYEPALVLLRLCVCAGFGALWDPTKPHNREALFPYLLHHTGTSPMPTGWFDALTERRANSAQFFEVILEIRVQSPTHNLQHETPSPRRRLLWPPSESSGVLGQDPYQSPTGRYTDAK